MRNNRAIIRQRNAQRRALDCPVLPSVQVQTESQGDTGPFAGYYECSCVNVQDEQRRCAAHQFQRPPQMRQPTRVEHPVVPSAHPTWFRVLRPYFLGDSKCIAMYELLGEYRDEQEAVAFCKTEMHRAIVANGRTNKLVYANEGAVLVKEQV